MTHPHDDLDAARGFVVGTLIGLLIWAVLLRVFL